jgi:hypothetical protein
VGLPAIESGVREASVPTILSVRQERHRVGAMAVASQGTGRGGQWRWWWCPREGRWFRGKEVVRWRQSIVGDGVGLRWGCVVGARTLRWRRRRMVVSVGGTGECGSRGGSGRRSYLGSGRCVGLR